MQCQSLGVVFLYRINKEEEMQVFAVVEDHTLEVVRLFASREGAEAYLADYDVVFEAHREWLDSDLYEVEDFVAPEGYDADLAGLYLSPEVIEYEVF